MRITSTSRRRVPDTPKWIRRKKALAAMREDMGTAPVGVVRTHYEFRCGGAISTSVGLLRRAEGRVESAGGA
jgi:hypothetical protein